MASLNQVNLIGNVTRDVELRYTPSGTAVAQVGLAVNEKYRDGQGQVRENVTFVDVTFFQKTAEIASQYLQKGSPVFISGKLKLDTWEDKQTGAKRSKLKVVGQNLQFLGRKPDGQQSQSSRPAQSRPSAAPQPPPGEEFGADEPVGIEEESVPF